MIRHFEIDNFKSLVGFSFPSGTEKLPGFVCLTGLNGAGKSNLLQALDFIGNLVSGKVDEWLNQRGWDKSDLRSRLVNRKLVRFQALFEFETTGEIQWEGAYNPDLQRCTSETIRCGNDVLLRIVENELRVHSPEGTIIRYPVTKTSFQGSVLSFVEISGVHPAVGEVKRFASSLRSLDMLAPLSMRKGSRESGNVGYGGEKLAGFLHGFKREQKERLLQLLQEFYPQLERWETKSLRAGWKALQVGERYLDPNRKPVELNIRQINDGMLRLMAILAQTAELGDPAQSDSCRCLLFDEIENGINPELMEKLVARLTQSSMQIFVTTHSPMILNYLPDEVARDSVFLLYRNEAGHTRSVRLFNLPTAQKKLEFLGPGEVFADSDLTLLSGEAESVERPQVS